MSAEIIGRVRSGSGKTYEVKWNQSGREVYVSVAGWTKVGSASSAGEAMRKAEAFVYNKYCSLAQIIAIVHTYE